LTGKQPVDALLLVVAGPGGAGKTTLCERLVAEEAGLVLSISATTRRPREGEVDGQHYFFTSREEFEKKAAAGHFAEHAEVAGEFYGTPREFLDERLAAGLDVLLDIDVQGAQAARSLYGDRAVSVFVLPADGAALEERLRGRRTDSQEHIAKRMGLAEREVEVACSGAWDYLVVNNRLEDALADLAAIRRAEHHSLTREGSRAAWALKTWT